VVGRVTLPDLADTGGRVEARVTDPAREEDEEGEERQSGEDSICAQTHVVRPAGPLDPVVPEEEQQRVDDEQEDERRGRREPHGPQRALRPVDATLKSLERGNPRMVVVQPHQQHGQRRERRANHQKPVEELGGFLEEGVAEARRVARANPPDVHVVEDDKPRQGQNGDRYDHADWSIRYAPGARKPR
jgi:hypothetical protein